MPQNRFPKEQPSTLVQLLPQRTMANQNANFRTTSNLSRRFIDCNTRQQLVVFNSMDSNATNLTNTSFTYRLKKPVEYPFAYSIRKVVIPHSYFSVITQVGSLVTLSFQETNPVGPVTTVYNILLSDRTESLVSFAATLQTQMNAINGASPLTYTVVVNATNQVVITETSATAGWTWRLNSGYQYVGFTAAQQGGASTASGAAITSAATLSAVIPNWDEIYLSSSILSSCSNNNMVFRGDEANTIVKTLGSNVLWNTFQNNFGNTINPAMVEFTFTENPEIVEISNNMKLTVFDFQFTTRDSNWYLSDQNLLPRIVEVLFYWKYEDDIKAIRLQ